MTTDYNDKNIIIDTWLKSWNLENIKDIPDGVTFSVDKINIKIINALSNSMTDYYDILNVDSGEWVKYITGPELRKILYKWLI